MGKSNVKEFIEKANQLHNNKYDYSQVNYVNSRTKVVIICPAHGSFEQLPSSHLQGNGCPKCARAWTEKHRRNLQESSRKSRGMTTDEWIARAKSVHGDKYDYSRTVYVNQRTDVEIICPIHGVFTQKADSHIRGCGCRACGNMSDNHKGVHNWSDEQREKIINTCLEKYGAKRYIDSKEGKARIAKIKSDPDFKSKMRDIISSADVQAKTKATCVAKYGVTSVMKLESVIDKSHESKIRNGSWRTSKPEEKMYELLCMRFGKNDVVRQYKDKIRYPFHSDFYVKSLDLFIELNATWLHGKHWFDKHNKSDDIMLNEWKRKAESGKKFYNVAINVWTVRDVRKHEAAIQNHLNYLVFWENDLSDFMIWLNSDSLILNNIL